MGQRSFGFPREGRSKADVLQALEQARSQDVNWQSGKVFGLIYDPGQEVLDLLKQAFTTYFSENLLNPTAFPSLRRLESEVVAMTADLLGGDGNTVGNMTTGGTESLLMAVKTARDWARVHRPDIRQPEMILPASAHPALEKAAQYFDVISIRTPTRADLRADVDAVREAISENTILIVGSAPCYPHGVVDPIEDLAELAAGEDLLFHCDACMGGFMLPFVRDLGYPVTPFDLQVPGVTSISADLHKYGYAAKGASVILYRDRRLRRHQLYAYTDWSGGIYASPTMTGTRAAGPIAAAWAVMNYLGREGYLRMAQSVMEATKRVQEGVAEIDGLEILGDPEMSIFAIGSDSLDLYEIGDEMTLQGWHLDRQQFPPSLHMTVNYGHADIMDAFLLQLREAVRRVRKPSFKRWGRSRLPMLAKRVAERVPAGLLSRLTSKASGLLGVQGSSLPGRSAPMYGMLGTLPNRGDLKEMVLDIVEHFTDDVGESRG